MSAHVWFGRNGSKESTDSTDSKGCVHWFARKQVSRVVDQLESPMKGLWSWWKSSPALLKLAQDIAAKVEASKSQATIEDSQ